MRAEPTVRAGPFQGFVLRGPVWHWLVPAVVAFALVLVVGWSVLRTAHPHEDAYILFKYARNLADGHGIVYWPGGPPAEGATDFLWLILVAALTSVGIDVALAACIGNAFGAGLLVYVAYKLVARAGGSPLLAWAPLLFLISGAAFAAYVGFSALLYCAVAALLYQHTVHALEQSTGARSLPWLALVLALFRPDGVLLGAGFVALGLLAARRAGRLGPFLRHVLGAGVAGALYFVWRWSYFGLALPLPLYVKAHGAAEFSWSGLLEDPYRVLPGLEANLIWLASSEGPLPLLAGCVVLWFLMSSAARRSSARWILLGLTPGVLLLASLCFARQTQNIGSRYQAPVYALALMALVALAAHVRDGRAWKRIAAALIVVAGQVPHFTTYLRRLNRVWEPRGYADTFSVRLGRILDPTRVLALTEAGRLAYWTDARVEDLVGLNTPRNALAPVDAAYLTSIDPDVVMFYASTFDLQDTLKSGDSVMPLDEHRLRGGLLPGFEDAYEHGVARFAYGLTPEKTSAMAAAKFLATSGRYSIFAVRHLGSFSHVYGIKKDLPEHDAIVDALRRTSGREGEYEPYWSAAHAR